MSALSPLWSQIGHPRILVVGDLVLDRYTFGETERISPEAPVLILRETEQDVRLGGAANVASFLQHLEAEVIVAGVVGADTAGQTLRRLCHEAHIATDGVVTVTDRPTTEKLRLVGQTGTRSPHQLLRVDREACHPVDAAVELRLVAAIRESLRACDALIISDYGKGVMTPTLLRAILTTAREADVPVLVDPSRGGDYQRYAGATLVAPNRLAAELWAGHPLRSPEQILTAVYALREQLDLAAAVITLDREGLAYTDGQERDILPGRLRTVCDVTGAGDMVQAILGLCLAEGVPLRESLLLANVAAGLEVERFGVVPLSREEIAAELRGGHGDKLTTLPCLTTAVESARRLGKTVVFTNGCFDLLHPGHVHMLQDAAKLGDLLIVAVNSDASVRRLKGPERPVLSEEDRARMLAALACVDHVVVFDDDTPHRLLKALQPDVLVKGGTTTDVVGREIVEAYGGQVCLTGAMSDVSTTRLIERMTARVPPARHLVPAS